MKSFTTIVPYEMQIQQVAPQTLAAVRGQANSKNVGEVIVTSLNQVWAFIKANEISHRGLNVAVYCPDTSNPGCFFTAEGVPVEVGVLINAPFESSGEVLCSATPGGRVAGTLHIGPYQKLSEAHAAVRNWCNSNGHTLAGPNWELYGHMTDDPNELRTEVFYLLK